MNIKIQYEGRLKSKDIFDNMIETIVSFCNDHKLHYFIMDERQRELLRVKNSRLVASIDYTKGIIVLPDPFSDPLIFEFDSNLYMQLLYRMHSGEEAYMIIIQLLQKIAVYFENLEMKDLGKNIYLVTKDTKDAQRTQV